MWLSNLTGINGIVWLCDSDCCWETNADLNVCVCSTNTVVQHTHILIVSLQLVEFTQPYPSANSNNCGITYVRDH